MKIWIAASIPEHSYGGVNRSMVMIGDGLKKLGHKITLYYDNSNNYLTFAFRLALRLIFTSDKPGWIIARSTDAVFCSLVSRLLNFKTRTILHSHGWEEKAFEIEQSLGLQQISNPTTWKSLFIRFPLLRLNLRLSSFCICGTLEEGKWIEKKYKNTRKKIKIIPNGIFVKNSPVWPKKNYYPPRFLIIGGSTWKKNIQYGLLVFNEIHCDIPEASLLVIGRMNEGLLSIGQSVQNIVTVHPDEMNQYYESHPFLLFTSLYEGGHAFTILEAQANGMIVFATRIPSTAEIVSHGKTGYFLSGNDPLSDAKLIKSVISDPEMIKQVGTSAFNGACRHRIDRQIKRFDLLLTGDNLHYKP